MTLSHNPNYMHLTGIFYFNKYFFPKEIQNKTGQYS